MYLASTIAFMWASFAWEKYLDFRQHKKLLETERPQEITSIVTKDTFEKAQAYGRDKSVFGFLKSTFTQLVTAATLYYGILPWLWALSAGLAQQYLGYGQEYDVSIGMIFLVINGSFDLATGLPFDLYYTFVLEEKHGFNKQTLALFVTDKIKETFFAILLGVPIMAGLLHVIKWGGEYFYIYVCAFVLILQLFIMTIYPVFIQPCFNKVEPLPEGELKAEIEKLASSIDYPLKKLYMIDGSKRSGHSNAYMYGFCSNKRIVLFDTLIAQSSVAEVVAVLGHELGHWKLSHTLKMMIINLLRTGAQFWLFGQVMTNEDLFADFGFPKDTMPTFIGFLLFQFVLAPVDTLLGFGNILLTRMHEFQADEFAVNLGYAEQLRSGLIKLQLENLGNMNPDKWYSNYHYSHPPLVERLQAIDDKAALRAKKGK